MKISRSFPSKLLAISIFLAPAFLITGQNLSPKKQIENCQKAKNTLDRYKKIVQEPYVIKVVHPKPFYAVKMARA
jgi:hypothetical protein